MFKKIYNIVFLVAFLAILATPLLFTKWESGGVSKEENRTLASFPSLMEKGNFNGAFTGQFETWFKDHLGFRDELITANAVLQFRVFNRMLDTSNYHIGPNGDVNYATEAMFIDYAHLNLRTEEEVRNLAEGFQTVNDWLEAQGKTFFYVQCYDKHSIYPEQFTDGVRQVGDVSKTDQFINCLQTETTVKTINLKEPLLKAKAEHEVFSNWGDPTHWSPRGAFVGYQYMMEQINLSVEQPLKVLEEQDYNIEIKNGGITLNKVVHKDDYYEYFTLKNPQAKRQDTAAMGKWQEYRHKIWENPAAGNDTKLLLVCDSYFDSYIAADIAESFGEVWLIWGDYIGSLPEILEIYDADVVLLECAERVDRTYTVSKLAQRLTEE